MPPVADNTADPVECRKKANECMELARRATDQLARKRFWRCMEMWLDVAMRLERLEQRWHNAPPKGPQAQKTTEAILRLGLKQAERHVAQGIKIIERQERLIADLEAHGHDARDAYEVLTPNVRMKKTEIITPSS